MYKIAGIVILSLFALVRAANPGDSKIVYPASFKPEDVNSLVDLNPEQALPLIFFKGDENNPLEYPMGLTQVELKAGRLASGTEFYTIPPKKQFFFCPFRGYDPSLTAQFETEFEKSQVLQCEHEPKPMIYPTTDKGERCGVGGAGILMGFLYKIFTGDITEDSQVHNFNIYTFCYDKTAKKVLFVKYKTVSAKLLSEPLLTKEQEIKLQEFVSLDPYKQIDQDYYKRLDEEARSMSKYEFQKLLPPEYMPLYSWRKSTHHYANIALQHVFLIDLWNEIQTHINTNATETDQLPRTIITAVSDIPANELPLPGRKGNEMHNIWITLIMDTNVETNYRGISIMMHNFITEEIDNGKTSTTKQQYIDNLCGEDLCLDGLKKKFDNVGGQVRCCKVNEKIKKLFFYKKEDLNDIDQVLEIRGITYDV